MALELNMLVIVFLALYMQMRILSSTTGEGEIEKLLHVQKIMTEEADRQRERKRAAEREVEELQRLRDLALVTYLSSQGKRKRERRVYIKARSLHHVEVELAKFDSQQFMEQYRIPRL